MYLHSTWSASTSIRQCRMVKGMVFSASILIRYNPSKLSLNPEMMDCPAVRETGRSTGTKFLVFVHRLHEPNTLKPATTSTSPIFVFTCTGETQFARLPH